MNRTRSLSSTFLSILLFFTASIPVDASIWEERRQIPKSHQTPASSVLLIQDIHQNVEAQEAISRLIQEEVRTGTRLLAVEGAEGLLDVSRFRSFEDRHSVFGAANFLLKQSVLAGSVHASLVAPVSLSFVGVDRMASHAANADAYRSAQAHVKTFKDLLARQEKELAEKKEKFNPALRAFDQQVSAYRYGRNSFKTYISHIVAHLNKVPSEVSDFINVLHAEDKLDFAKLEVTRRRLMANPQDSGALMEFEPYLAYLKKADALDAAKLLQMADDLEKKAYQTLCRSDEERQTVQEDRRYYLSTKLADFSLSRQEWEEYKAIESKSSEREHFEDFYRYAEDRDRFMAENLVSAMRAQHQSRAILVAGGFHAAPIERALADHGIRVERVSPKISTVPSMEAGASLRLFVQSKTPLEKLFTGETLFLAPKVLTGPQRVLTASVAAIRHLWLSLGQLSTNHFRDIVAQLSGQAVKEASFVLDEKGGGTLKINGKAVAYIGLQAGVQLNQLSVLPESSPQKTNYWAAFREWPAVLKLFFGRKPLIQFLKRHSYESFDAFKIRVSGAVALQRVLWLTATTGVIVAYQSGYPGFVWAAAGIGFMAVSGHLLHNMLFPAAQLSINPSDDSGDFLSGILKDLIEIRKTDPTLLEFVTKRLEAYLQQNPAAFRLLRQMQDIVEESRLVDETRKLNTFSHHLGNLIVAVDNAYRYINSPLTDRVLLREAADDPDYPKYSYDLLTVLENTKSFQLGLRYMIDYFTDQDKVGKENAEQAHRIFLRLNYPHLKKVLKIMAVQLAPELKNIEVLIAYEVRRYQKLHEEQKNNNHRGIRTLLDTRIDTLEGYDPSEEKMQEVSCPICGHEHNIKEDPTVGQIFVNDNQMFIAKCPNDGMMWQTPQPGETYFKNLYGENYFPSHSEADTTQFGIRAFFESEDERRNQLAELQLDEWERFGGLEKAGTLIEIGPGSGNLLKAAINRGWAAVGIDYSEYVATRLYHEKELPVVQGTLESYAEDPTVEPVDVIAMYDLIEHVRGNGEDFMLAAKKLLKPDGLLVIRTPNHIGRKPRLHLIDHLMHFTPHTLSLFLKKYGFEIIDAKPSGIFAEDTTRLTLENMTVFARPIKPNSTQRETVAVARQGVGSIDGKDAVDERPASVTVVHVGEVEGNFSIQQDIDRVIKVLVGTDPKALNDIVIAASSNYKHIVELEKGVRRIKLSPHMRLVFMVSDAQTYDDLLNKALDQFTRKNLPAVEALLTGSRKATLATVSRKRLLDASDWLVKKWAKMIIDIGEGLTVFRAGQIEAVLKARRAASTAT